MKKPRLHKGDRISLQSLSAGLAGEASFYPRYLRAKGRLTTLFEFQALPSPHALKGIKYIAEHPEKRAQDLMEAIKDYRVKGIFAIIGGLDSKKIYPYIDLAKINQHPKFLIGYSDTTSVHLMFYQANVQSFYGPSCLDNFAENVQMHNYTKNSFEINAFGNKKQNIEPAPFYTSQMLAWENREYDNVERIMTKEEYGFIWLNGAKKISGHLLGGCLETLADVHQEPFFPTLEQWKNSIMFLETSQEKFNSEEMEKNLEILKPQIEIARAIIFGKPKDTKHFDDYLSILKTKIAKPIVFNLNFGHAAPIITIPYGGKATLNFTTKKIMIEG